MIMLLPWAGNQARLGPEGGHGGEALAIATVSPQQAPTRRLTEQESEDLRLLLHQLLLSLLNQRISMLEPVDRLASGIRPFAITFNFAFDTLRRTLPGYSVAPPPDESKTL
jgi:hypothetical protein